MSKMAMPSGGDDSRNQRALVISAILTGIYFVVELVAGILIGSVAVLSDAFHTFSAVAGVGIALAALSYARRPPTPERTYGFIRAEIFGAFANGFFLLGMAIFVIVMGAMRLSDPKDLATTPMLLVAAGGLVTEVISLGLLYDGQKKNLNLKGAYWHVVQTFIGSLIIVVAALVIRFTGFLEIDPLLGMAFGVFLLWASFGIIKESIAVFLEATPRGTDLLTIKRDIEALPGVVRTHHMHAWSLASGRNIFSAHVLQSDEAGPELLDTITQMLMEKYGFYFSTVQIESSDEGEEGAEEIEFLRHEKFIP
ncbi:MAG: cation transporter [Chloroflexi bacterium]|nr:cation transporter [Chloroflexota bacterium]